MAEQAMSGSFKKAWDAFRWMKAHKSPIPGGYEIARSMEAIDVLFAEVAELRATLTKGDTDA